MFIKGVNLGNWLVLEKWMNPALFEGTTAEDEYYLPRQLPPEVYEARIRTHRSEYITERDFAAIRRMGLNAVRIPVPYFIFGDRAPFLGCIAELDKAFAWASRYGLKILIDLHTAPMSQNGFDNGGICGVCRWAQLPDEVEFILHVLERLAQRYGTHEALWGIEVLNEPTTELTWDKESLQAKYHPVDPELEKGTGPVPMNFLRNFYCDAYDRLRQYLPEDKYIVIHDAFVIDVWDDFMQDEKYKNVILDTHQYFWGEIDTDSNLTPEAYCNNLVKEVGGKIAKMEQSFPVICGEWCLTNPFAHGKRLTALSEEEKASIYRLFGEAELKAWRQGSGYFYWSYKLLTDTVNNPGQIGSACWDLGRCYDLGWFPDEN